IVIGAGPAGATSALALARRGWSVALIEKTLFPRRKVCGEFISASNAAVFRALGLEEAVSAHAGPEVRRVGIFAGTESVVEVEARRDENGRGWGFAVSREALDALIVQAARSSGVDVLMPWRVIALETRGERRICTVAKGTTQCEIGTPIVILAHGSWEQSTLPTQARRNHRRHDLLAFKARFQSAPLDRDLMPLLAFPGGYGGMVNSSDNSLSLTFCIRRDALQSLRGVTDGRAGEIALTHIKTHCASAAAVLQDASLTSPILAAGPIRPGIRPRYAQGTFRVGNIAGEAHPVVAEGISMALQGANLLATLLAKHEDDARAGRNLDAIGRLYAAEWRRRFAPRIYTAAMFAHLAMRPAATTLLAPLFTRFPPLLTWGATLSGKTYLLFE
ncbi:MAG TPA: FAD-dependent oxidoreductase, partial [Methylovirgula sp.]|nr:FAD-dependent oxidoreductase [Methylovirgula sp.]